ncbi:MAG TPA: hypothetical protein VEW48_28970 [Thermoanaerobaculia bacterium]|nr:hypothetical protein [Thermoanaerobaculia bacterium]
MLKLKTRTFPLIALTAALTLAPLAEASAAASPEPAETGFMAQLEEQISLVVSTLQAILTDVGPRMDDNG